MPPSTTAQNKAISITYLSYALLKQIRTATCGEHTRVVATENGRRVAVSANPLNECSSLDVRLDESDEGSSTKGETIEDPAAVQAFQQAEDDIYTEELHTTLETAMTQHSTEREATVLCSRYYDEVGERLPCSSQNPWTSIPCCRIPT